MSTYVPIQAITLTSDTPTITFTGIPQTYTDLIIVGNIASTGDDLVPTIRVGNGTIDTGSNYSQTTAGIIFGAGVTSFRDSNDTRMRLGRGGSSPTQPRGVFTLQFQNYANTTTNKTVLARNSAFDRSVVMCAGLWRSTSAINTIQFIEYSGGSYVAGSTFTLYGVGSGSPKAFGGDRVFTDGSFWYHIYNSSGRFEPAQDLICDYVVVAGGGGGAAGGSGAGGFRTSIGGSPLNLAAQGYTVTIGAGGTGANVSYNGTTGRTKGNDSVFSTITSSGGGAGGGYSVEVTGGGIATALSGGSGGGASYSSSQAKYGSGISGEGNNGGQDNFDNPPYASAGGGGAGAVGQNNISDAVAGSGGIGVFNAITNGAQVGQLSGGNYYLAGGGGGAVYGLAGSGTAGSGGLGGGGNGSNGASGTTPGANGTANTGGGAGGSSADATGRQGGSGIVIVRYAV